MSKPFIHDVANKFGLTLEIVRPSEQTRTLRVLKGLKQIFIGTEMEVQAFLARYERERPGLMQMDMIGYQE
ncbi:MAG: hypothetical protein JO053_00340 [Acidobacteria bacterium]|nr:hypothetical protein [Acidobacteriota bacterium]